MSFTSEQGKKHSNSELLRGFLKKWRWKIAQEP